MQNLKILYFYQLIIQKLKNLKIKNSDIKIFSEMPEIEISEDLQMAVLNAMKNKYVKAARVLDTKDGGINTISLMILLDNFDEETLISGLNVIKDELDCDFYTLSYIVKFLKNNMN